MSEDQSAGLMVLTSDIVSAFVNKNTVRMSELPELIASVHASLAATGTPKVNETAPAEAKPAVPIKKSITEEYLICLEDGKKFKSLKRHLRHLGLTPDEYRQKWGLDCDYPMVAARYAEKRSELARANGLGFTRRKEAARAPEAVEAPAAEVEATPTKKGRRPPRTAA